MRNRPSLSGAFTWPSFRLPNPFKVYLCPAVLVSRAGNSLSPAAPLCCPLLECKPSLLKGFHLIPCKLSGVVQSDLFCKPLCRGLKLLFLTWARGSGERSPLPGLCAGVAAATTALSHSGHGLCWLCSPAGKPAPGSFQGTGGKKNPSRLYTCSCLKRLNS